MHYITIEQREFLQKVLSARLATLRDEIADALGSRETRGFADHREETDDDAVIDLESSLESLQLERRSLELGEVEGALRRLHSAEFGECVDCGAEIPFARLRVNAMAKRCVACQAKLERASPSPGHAKL